MSPAPASRSRRSATVAATTATSSSSSSHTNPSGPPPPPPSNHPKQSVQAYSSQQILVHLPNPLPLRHDYHQYDDPQENLQHSYSESNLYSQQPPQQPTQITQQPQQQQQENWSEYNWRTLFDAALVKAQQAVQLDEQGEAVMATQLYAQAANDLGRVIPMCGSEKKKQSMLTIVSSNSLY